MPDTTHTLARARKVASFDLALFYVVCVFLALLGGSSRYDLMQLPILQVGLWALLAVALFRMSEIPFGRSLLVLAVLYAAWLAFQVIPLPHGVWTSLPGRGPMEQVEVALDSHHARPFSMVPHRTLNALGGFAAVLTPFVAAMNLGRSAPKHIAIALISIGSVSALLALSQVQLGRPYLYSVTNTGKPVGLFANSNHFAVCTAMVIVLTGYVTRFASSKLQPAVAILVLVLVVSVLVGPSRAGLLTLAISMVAFFLFWIDRLPSKRFFGERIGAVHLVLIGAIAVVLALAAALLSADRLPAMERLLTNDAFADMRFAILPTLLVMISEFLPLGSGTGTFENVYYIFEERANMQASYVNMAHNDVLQLLIEGGVVAFGFVIALVVVIASMVRSARRHHPDPRALLIICIAMVVIVMLASAADYPLRAPLFQANVALLLAALAALSHNAKEQLTDQPDPPVESQ